MNNFKKNIRNLLLPASLYVPFTFYFLLFAVGGCLGYLWLVQNPITPDTLYSHLFSLLLQVAAWFLGIVLLLALLTAAVPLVYFFAAKKSGRVGFVINTAGVLKNKAGLQQQGIYIKINPIIKPFLGFIKMRLKYDGTYSNKFLLANRSQNKLISTTLEGDYTWKLPEIKEYHIDRVVVYFEDFFQFFSFVVSLPIKEHFYTPPAFKKADGFSISPRKTEDTDKRIDELKKVEGEVINYKNFENNDDVRRIVWKIYARNKELVVRIPEILDPYASQAYLYASFFTSFNTGGNRTVDIYFLNYYKTILWAVYQKLSEQGFDIRYMADQRNHSSTFINEEKAVEYAVSTSNWQTEKDLRSYVNIKDASVVVLSSLSDVAQAQELLQAATGNTWFVLVRLSKSLNRTYLVGLLQWLFIQQEKSDLEKYKTGWELSLLRPKVTQNEKKLTALFSTHEKTIVI